MEAAGQVFENQSKSTALRVGRSDQRAPCLGRRGRILARIGVVGSVRICRLCHTPRLTERAPLR